MAKNVPGVSAVQSINSRTNSEVYEKKKVITILCRDGAASNVRVVTERQGMSSCKNAQVLLHISASPLAHSCMSSCKSIPANQYC